MNEVHFEYELAYPCIGLQGPINYVDVLASEDGTGILLIDFYTDEELNPNVISTHDLLKIKELVKDHANHLKYLKEQPDVHPGEDKNYVNWLNKGCP